MAGSVAVKGTVDVSAREGTEDGEREAHRLRAGVLGSCRGGGRRVLREMKPVVRRAQATPGRSSSALLGVRASSCRQCGATEGFKAGE